jgi:hypothetical protein
MRAARERSISFTVSKDQDVEFAKALDQEGTSHICEEEFDCSILTVFIIPPDLSSIP